MALSDLNESQKTALRRQVWTPEKLARREAYRLANDQPGVDRITFGSYLKMMRLGCNLTQAQAAKSLGSLRKLEGARKSRKPLQVKRDRKNRNANLDRVREEWNSWEQGRHLPKDVTIRRIAAVLDGDPAAFLRQAGRPVPKELLVYDEVWATRIFRDNLREAKFFVQLADAVQVIWQQYTFEQTGATRRMKIDRAYSEVLELAYLYLDEKQLVKLARHIVKNRSDYELEKHVKDAMKLRQEVDERFKTLAYPQLSPAMHDALEGLGIIPGRFDGMTNEMKMLIAKLNMRDQEPITNPESFISELVEYFEAVSELQQELTVIDDEVTKVETKVNYAMQDFVRKRAEVLELIYRLCEMIAKLQRRVATIVNPPQRTLNALETALAENHLLKKTRRPRLTGTLPSPRKRS